MSQQLLDYLSEEESIDQTVTSKKKTCTKFLSHADYPNNFYVKSTNNENELNDDVIVAYENLMQNCNFDSFSNFISTAFGYCCIS